MKKRRTKSCAWHQISVFHLLEDCFQASLLAIRRFQWWCTQSNWSICCRGLSRLLPHPSPSVPFRWCRTKVKPLAKPVRCIEIKTDITIFTIQFEFGLVRDIHTWGADITCWAHSFPARWISSSRCRVELLCGTYQSVFGIDRKSVV